MRALGIGLARFNGQAAGSADVAAGVLDALFPILRCGGDDPLLDGLSAALGRPSEAAARALEPAQLGALLEGLPEARLLPASPSPVATGEGRGGGTSALDAGRSVRPVAVYLPDLSASPSGVADVFLRLHLLSARLVRPHGLSLEGVFGLLPTMVWTAHGPYGLEEFEDLRLRALAGGWLPEVRGVDKFPRMVDYVIPGGVRIGDPARVRLGAHLGEGTTVMHEGFVNYNAGTLGKAMIEGRVSAGVVVGDGSDVGGGASIMGTLSGGGKEVISLGRECLVGANAGLGISLGDRCTVEAGLYVTAGTKARLPDGGVVKASVLSGANDLLFRRNSQDGAVEVLHKRNEVVLNPALHA